MDDIKLDLDKIARRQGRIEAKKAAQREKKRSKSKNKKKTKNPKPNLKDSGSE